MELTTDCSAVAGVRGIVKNTNDEPLSNVSYTVLGREQVVMTTNEHGEFSRLLLGKYTIQVKTAFRGKILSLKRE